ncbi:murein biosynthesis integral membrane protein MurJ [Halobacillus sp. A5]|uniref:murein biosynthesis integral membrane protein MurJ n=1 Tax=Halobacillus sp. A5 TaxID=2880263 RepID=UPI0020A67948|nr:murein biosynthesis integral membrane protein MurJ [Halobacillus sp. A5]MCP3028080.1 murein biosynthesis integral membrane protein MurJ [Halobacillus sp. A5]
MKWIKLFGIITILSAIGKLLGFFREAFIASLFGASETADVFFVAYLIPTILFTALGTGIQAGIIPLYIQKKESSPYEANILLNKLAALFLLVSLGITIAGMVVVKPIIFLFAPGFSADQSDLAVGLTLVMMPSLFFMTAQSFAQGILHARTKFGPPAWAPIVNNVGIIVSMFLLYQWLDIYGLAAGVLIGSVLQIAVQWPFLPLKDFKIIWPWKEWASLKSLIQPFWPIILAALIVQLNSVVDRVVASFLAEGSVSALNYGNRLLWLPLSILLMPISTILYPQLARMAVSQVRSFVDLVHRGISIIIILSIPVMVIMLVEAELLVSTAFQRGAFDEKAGALTTTAFLFYSIALPFFALREYLMNSVYAYHSNHTALKSCVLGVGVNVVLSIVLAPVYGVGGIASATSISMLVQSAYLYFNLLNKTGPAITNYFKDWAKCAGIFLIILPSAWFLSQLIPSMSNWVELVIITLSTFTIYSILLWVCKVAIFKKEWNNLMNRGAAS